MRILIAAVALVAVVASQAQAQPVLTACSAAVAASTGADVTPTLGAHAAGDVMVLVGLVRDNDDTVTVGGGTWTALTGSPWTRSTVERYFVFWKRAASAAETNPLFDKSTATGDTYVWTCNWRGATSADPPFDIGTGGTGTSDPATCTALTTTVEDTSVAIIIGYGDNNNASIVATGTDPANYLELFVPDATGSDGSVGFAFATKNVAGSTGTGSVDFSTSVTAGDGWGCVMVGVLPETGVLGRRHRIHLLGVGLSPP